ncbi:MAG: ribosome recycling factor [Dehalococcoidia bacterium]
MSDAQKAAFPTVTEVLMEAEEKMQKAVEALKRELAGFRTGRARPSLVEHLRIDYYGVPTPLNQLASVSAPEAQLLVIQPWDRQALPMIEKGLLKSDLGLNPASDGTVIRLPVPPLSEERRREMVRLLRKRVEDHKVTIRNIRRDALDRFREMERSKVISQDESRYAQEQLQRLTDATVALTDGAAAVKEAEILQV